MLFDVTDETSISHFSAPRYRRFCFGSYVVSAVDSFSDTLCKSSELVGEEFSPNLFFVALYDGAVLSGLADDRVSGGFCFRDCDVFYRIGVL